MIGGSGRREERDRDLTHAVPCSRACLLVGHGRLALIAAIFNNRLSSPLLLKKRAQNLNKPIVLR
jgi:hypothetical protein